MKSDLLLSYINKKAYLNKVPITAVIELLTLCNFRCEHCYIPHRASGGMEYEVVKELLNDLRKMGTLSVLLTGGEVFLREDIFDIIAYARSLHTVSYTHLDVYKRQMQRFITKKFWYVMIVLI